MGQFQCQAPTNPTVVKHLPTGFVLSFHNWEAAKLGEDFLNAAVADAGSNAGHHVVAMKQMAAEQAARGITNATD